MNTYGLNGNPGITGHTGMKGKSAPPCVITYCDKNYSMLITEPEPKSYL